jgi:hypothetical protein
VRGQLTRLGSLITRTWAGIKKRLGKEEQQPETPEDTEKRKHRIETIKRAYEPGPHELRTSREQDFERLSAELQRQFELQWQADATVDTKSGIILGFIMLILVQIALSLGFIDTITSRSQLITALFLIGYGFIFGSFIVGMISFRLRTYKLGPSVLEKMFPAWWDKEEHYHYAMDIFTLIASSHEHNTDVSGKKVKYIKWMLNLFLVGFVLILTSTILFEMK